MRSYIYSGALLVVLMLHTAWAQAPAVIGYQGVLTDGSGTAVADGTHTLSFGLYEMASGGIAVWTESQTVATVNGVFHANLGSASPLGIDFDRALWLGIGVDGGAELSPRLALTGSPYSLIARSVADGAVTGGKIADGAVSAADLADDAVTTSRVADGAITSAKIADGSIRAVDVAGGEMVTGVNGLQDGVTLAAGANVTITPSGNTLTIASAGGSGGGGLADGSVTSAKIADGGVGTVDLASAAVSAAKLADGSVTGAKIADGTIASDDLGDGAVTSVQIADGSITAADVAAGEVVKSVNGLQDAVTLVAGSNVMITPSGNSLSISANMGGGAGTGDIADNAITAPKILDGAVTGAKLLDGSVGAADLADGAVTSAKIVDGTIGSGDLGDGSVTGAKVADGSLSAADVASGQVVTGVNGLQDAVTLAAGSNVTITPSGNTLTIASSGSGSLADDAVTSAKIADGSITAADVAGGEMVKSVNGLQDAMTLVAGSNVTITPSGNSLSISASTGGGAGTGDIADNAVTTPKILDGSVTGAKLLDGTVGAADLADGSVTSAKIADGTIESGDLADGAVSSAKVQNGAITGGKIADGAVAAADLGDGAVTSAKIADGTVGSTDLADGSVTSAKIVDGTVGSGDLAGDAVVSGKIADGTVAAADLASDAVTTAKLQDGAVTSVKVADGTIGSADLASDAVTTAQVQDGAVTSAKIADGTVAAADIGADQVVKSVNGLQDALTLAAGSNVTITPSGNTLTIASSGGGTLADNAVTSAKIADGAVGSGDLANNAVTGGKIADGTIAAADVAGGEMVKSVNGLKDAVTLVAGSNVTITPSGNSLSISASTGGGVGTGDIADNAITTAKILDGAVTSAKIIDGTIAVGDLANGAVTSAKIADGTVAAANLGSDAVVTVKLQDGAVTSGKIADGTIAAGDIGAAQVVKSVNGLQDVVTLAAGSNVTITPSGNTLTVASSGGSLADGSVTSAKLADGGVATVDLADNAVTSAKIADGTIASADMAANAVTTAQIADGTIATADLAADAVTAAKIQDGAISSADIADGTVAVTDLANDAVVSTKIADGTIASADMANNAVTTTQIADGTVVEADLAGNAVTSAKIADGTITAGDIGASQVVKSVNSLKDAVTLAAGANVTITPSGNTLTIAATGGGGNTLDAAYDQGGSGAGRTITADNGAVDIAGAGGLTVNGSVGIGTTSPGAKLAVTQSGATNADGLRIVNGGTTWNQYSDGGGRLLFESSGGAQVAVQDDGNTGIGTASPGSHRLAVLAGNAAAASASEHISATNGLSGGSLSEVNMGVDAFGGYVQSTNSKPLALNPAGNSVGIGTTNPGQKLTVDGGNFQILSAGNLYLNDAGNTTTGALWNSGGGDINLGLIGNAKMTVKGTGFVGIGTTAPTHTLSFNSVTGTKISLYDDGTAQAKYGFGVEGSELRAAYTGFMSFYSGGYGGTQRMLIDANGRLGIGTASPADLLHVESSNNSASIFGISAAGSVSGGGVENISLRNANSTAGNGSAIMARNSSGAVAGFIGFTNINHNTAATAQGALSLHVADGAGGFIEGIRLSSNGKVGIGTTNPYTRLDIVGDSNGAVRVTNTGADATNKTLNLVLPEYTVANGHLRVIGGYASAADNTVDIGGGYSGYDAATKIRFYTGSALNTDTGTSRMEITAAGNVGIGTASPAAKLDINGDIGFPGNSNVVIGRTAAQTPTPTTLTIRSNIANTGASPNSGAHIILHSGFNAGGSYGQIEYNTQSAGAAGADAGDHIFSTGGTTLTERMRIDFAGNVGIGTASPTSMLHIADNTTPADNEWASIKAFANGNSFIWGHSNTEYDNAIGTLNGGGNPFISFFSYHGATANTLKYSSGSIPPGRFIYSAGGQLYYDTAATGTQDTDIATWNTRLAILNDGKIGIGTTAPSEKLSIEEGHINLNHATIPYMRIQRAGAEHGYIGSAGALFGGTQTDFGVRAESNLIFGTSSTEHMRIASSGNVGIGTSSPGAVLHAFDPITTASTPKTVAILETDNEGAGAGPEMLFKYGAAGSNFLAKIRSDGGPNPFGGSLRFFTEPPGADGTDRLVERLTILDNGNVGIGRIPAANPLEVEGNASKTTAGDWLANSDARLKTDIEEIEGGLDIIARLRPVKFRYSDAYREQHPSVEDRFYYNFIAQEFREIFPESVQDDGTGYLQVDTYSVRPFLVRAVQELNGKVEVLQAENEGLKRSNEELESRVDALAVAVRRLEALTAGLEGDGDGKEILAGTE